MRNYMKKREEMVNAQCLTADEVIAKVGYRKKKRAGIFFIPVLALCIAIPAVHAVLSLYSVKPLEESNETGKLAMATVPVAATTTKKDLISIPSGTVKANPFLPYRDISGSGSAGNVPQYDLVEPPEIVSEDSEAARVMDTVVSGILYDKYSPSAILNIEGNDYLVKKGDVVNNYKILNIMQDSVTVKLGSNTYKAGIGEILTEGSINYNDVSNLNKKFGGKNDEI